MSDTRTRPMSLGAVIRFTIPGPPRTKKTHNEIITIRGRCTICEQGRKAERGFHLVGAQKIRCKAEGFHKILPSEQYRAWFKMAMTYAPAIVATLRRQGIELPLAGWLNCKALFYLERDTGDATGYYQALGDYLQEQKILMDRHRRVPVLDRNGRAKLRREGAGIIGDDRQIRRWWGSELFVDRAKPRIEVELEVVGERPVARDLFGSEEDVFGLDEDNF